HLAAPGRCDLPAASALDEPLARAERAALAGLPRTSYVDFTRLICGAAVCPAQVGGMIRFRDTNHLTAGFVAALTPHVAAAMDAALRDPGASPGR
ncbi:MAG TPA: SGNH hydrolase domain-containing protein, partial [Longimicrobiaceae bacterium]|nr:SGNH hydrolase domain-containing protein [Longimicrobiaceae bacterium]